MNASRLLTIAWTSGELHSEFARRIEASQRPGWNSATHSCTTGTRAVVVDWRMKDHGLGSDVHTWSNALCHAVTRGEVLQTIGSWVWRAEAFCERHEAAPLSCYFGPLAESPCLHALWPQFRQPQRRHGHASPPQCGGVPCPTPRPRARDRVSRSWSNRAVHTLENMVAHAKVPRGEAAFAHAVPCSVAGHTTRELHAAAMGYLFRRLPDRLVAQAEDAARATFGPRGVPPNLTTVGTALRQKHFSARPHAPHRSALTTTHHTFLIWQVYVRWGDKWKESKLLPIESYVDSVTKLTKDVPRSERHVFVMSEDAAALNAFRRAAPSAWKLYTYVVIKSYRASLKRRCDSISARLT